MFRRVLFAAVALGLYAGSASAQCFTGPDGLNVGPCWGPVQATLPAFSSFALPATNICWNNCDPAQDCSQVAVATPIQQACGQYIANLTVSDCGANPMLGGALHMDYTRTWEEIDVALSRRLQVYRFVVKIDMQALGPVTTCFSPACLSSVPTAFYYGYVDYAFDCSNGSFETVLVLFHNCDMFIHHPLSTVPGTYHPNVSYAIVGPDTAANPFTPSINTPPTGFTAGFEGLRSAPSGPGAPCVVEERMSSTQMSPLGAGCGCSFSFVPPQLAARTFSGVTFCFFPGVGSTQFRSASTMPAFPWLHMMTTSIGNWNSPAGGYPGEEVVWVDEVPIFLKDTCAASQGLKSGRGQVYYGASTSLGYDVVAPLLQNFTDLASNTTWAVPGPPPATFMGRVLPTRNLIYATMP